METELKNRLQAYAATAEPQIPADPPHFADALSSSQAAATAASAAIICSHTRVLRGDSLPAHLLPGQKELDLLIADPARKPGQADETAAPDALPARRLPFPPGAGTLEKLVLGAKGIPSIKGQHG